MAKHEKFEVDPDGNVVPVNEEHNHAHEAYKATPPKSQAEKSDDKQSDKKVKEALAKIPPVIDGAIEVENLGKKKSPEKNKISAKGILKKVGTPFGVLGTGFFAVVLQGAIEGWNKFWNSKGGGGGKKSSSHGGGHGGGGGHH